MVVSGVKAGKCWLDLPARRNYLANEDTQNIDDDMLYATSGKSSSWTRTHVLDTMT